MEWIYIGIIAFLFFLAISDLIVGVSNDAVNFLNSAVGAKSASFRTIIIIAAIGVFAGATMSNGMMEIARHGIYQPQFFSFEEIICIMLAVMVTDVIILDAFNSMGLPTSTTVSLVFELLGGTVALALLKNISSDGALTFSQMINSEKALTVVLGIFLSIALAFFFGALVQYITRRLFTFNYRHKVKWAAGIIGGIAVTAILYFMVIKGLKDASFMTADLKMYIKENTGSILLLFFIVSGIIMQILALLKVNIFKVIVLIGTFALAMAFAGNDLVNFIGIPLAGYSAFQDWSANGVAIGADNYMMESLMGPAKTPLLFLIAAGAIMVLSLMTSKKAKNVIKTSVNLSRQDNSDEMFGTSAIARRIVTISNSIACSIQKIIPEKVSRFIDSRFNKDEVILENGAAFDQLRAAVNLVIASLLIALGTSLKLPLSTTFVTFMVAMGTSLADRAWGRESAVFRVTGMISVIGGWFLTAIAAFLLCFIVTMAMHFGSFIVMFLLSAIAIAIIIRSNVKYAHENMEEKRDSLYQQIMECKDPQLLWELVCRHIRENVIGNLKEVEKMYSLFTDAFKKQNRRTMKKLSASVNEQIRINKSIRKKEIRAFMKLSPGITAQANTWFHITSNHSVELLYGLRRSFDPCLEHIENNFNPLPAEKAEELDRLGETLDSLYIKVSDFISSYQVNDGSDPTAIIKEISHFKSQITETIKENLKGLTSEKNDNNLNINILYQTVLQETYQQADNLKHLIRAFYRLINVS